MRRSHRIALALARPYIRRRLRRAFDGVFVEGLSSVRELAQRGPFIVAVNHVCWWDALTILAIDAELEAESRCLMDAENLKRLPFFGWVGAIPLDRHSPRAAVAGLRHAVRQLHTTGGSLWIFPQGEQRPAHVRPLRLNPGVKWLAKRAECPVVPLSLSYLYREAPEPSIIASFGPAIPPPSRSGGSRSSSSDGWLSNLENALADGLERDDEFAMSGAGSFEEVVAPRPPSGVPVAGLLLARLLGGGSPSDASQAHGNSKAHGEQHA